MQPSRFHPHMLQQILQQSEFASCIVITFQVMAVAWVSPGNPHAVGAVPEGGQDEFGADPGRAGHPDDPEIGRVLEAADPCQVCRTVAAPVAKKVVIFGCQSFIGIHSVLSISGSSILVSSFLP